VNPEPSNSTVQTTNPPYNGAPADQKLLLFLGVGLLLLPLIFVVVFPEHYEKARVTLRIMSAVGGALIGAWLPGFFNLTGPLYRVGGALAILVLFFLFDPPAATNTGVNNESPDAAALNIPAQPAGGETSNAPPPESVAPAPASPTLACSFVPIKAIGWRSGHKTNYCKNYGYEHGNFNQGDYRNGGICMSGPEPEVCKAKVTNTLKPEYACELDGIKTTCLKRPS
jgi:hypothetical protein